ncbi:MAG: hypothetical protein ACRC42_02400 [Mycoplasma sp.]
MYNINELNDMFKTNVLATGFNVFDTSYAIDLVCEDTNEEFNSCELELMNIQEFINQERSKISRTQALYSRMEAQVKLELVKAGVSLETLEEVYKNVITPVFNAVFELKNK